jgi:hypothetical protein
VFAGSTVETATRTARAGGIAVFSDQPNTIPRVLTPELIARRAQLFVEQSYVDYAIQSHPPEDAGLAPELGEAGAFGLVFFTVGYPPWNMPFDMDKTKERMGSWPVHVDYSEWRGVLRASHKRCAAPCGTLAADLAGKETSETAGRCVPANAGSARNAVKQAIGGARGGAGRAIYPTSLVHVN